MADKITVRFKDETYVITPSEVFDVCDQIEAVATVGELSEMFANGKKLRFSTLARAYSVMLNFAGAKTDPREIREMFLADVRAKEGAEKLKLAHEAIGNLLFILMDGAPVPEVKESPLDDGGAAPAS